MIVCIHNTHVSYVMISKPSGTAWSIFPQLYITGCGPPLMLLATTAVPSFDDDDDMKIVVAVLLPLPLYSTNAF